MTIIDSNAPGPARLELDQKREERKAKAQEKKDFEAWKIQQIDLGNTENLTLEEFRRQQAEAAVGEPEEVKVEGLDGPPAADAGQDSEQQEPPMPQEEGPATDPSQPAEGTPPPADAPSGKTSAPSAAPSSADAPPAASTEAPEVKTAARQFAEEKGAQVVHRTFTEVMRAQGREIKEELRLFPRLPAQDLELDRAIAAALVEAYVNFTNPPLLRAVQSLLAGVQAYDGIDAHDPTQGRYLIDAASVHKLGQVLALPAGDGKERMTVQSISQGAYLQAINDAMKHAAKVLDQNDSGGEVKVVAEIKIKSNPGSFLRDIRGTVDVKTGKLEHVEFATKAAGRDGELTLWNSNSAQNNTKETQAKAKAKNQGGRKGIKPGSEAAAQSA